MGYVTTIPECDAGEWPELTWTQFVQLCGKYGPLVRTELSSRVNPLDGTLLLLAIGGSESSSGQECKPRHETGYCTGFYSHNQQIIALTKLFGHGAHCSYGPWQIMLVNAEPGATPDKFRDAEYGAAQTVRYMNQILRARNAPISLSDWGEEWNGGHVGARNPGVLNYCDELQKNWTRAEQEFGQGGKS